MKNWFISHLVLCWKTILSNDGEPSLAELDAIMTTDIPRC